jgi:hypothetical protein
MPLVVGLSPPRCDVFSFLNFFFRGDEDMCRRHVYLIKYISAIQNIEESFFAEYSLFT